MHNLALEVGSSPSNFLNRTLRLLSSDEHPLLMKATVIVAICASFLNSHEKVWEKKVESLSFDGIDLHHLGKEYYEDHLYPLLEIASSTCMDCFQVIVLYLKLLTSMILHSLNSCSSAEQNCLLLHSLERLLYWPHRVLTNTKSQRCAIEHVLLGDFIRVKLDPKLVFTKVAINSFFIILRKTEFRDSSVRDSAWKALGAIMRYALPEKYSKIVRACLKRTLKKLSSGDLDTILDLYTMNNITNEELFEFLTETAHNADAMYRKKLANCLIKRLEVVTEELRIVFYAYLIRFWADTDSDSAFLALMRPWIQPTLKNYELHLEKVDKVTCKQFLALEASLFIKLTKYLHGNAQYITLFITRAVEACPLLLSFLRDVIDILFEVFSEAFSMSNENAADILTTLTAIISGNEATLQHHLLIIANVMSSKDENFVSNALKLLLAYSQTKMPIIPPSEVTRALFGLILRGSKVILTLSWNCLNHLASFDKGIMASCQKFSQGMLQDLNSMLNGKEMPFTVKLQRYLMSLAAICRTRSNLEIELEQFETVVITLWKIAENASKPLILNSLLYYLEGNPWQAMKPDILEICRDALAMGEDSFVIPTIALFSKLLETPREEDVGIDLNSKLATQLGTLMPLFIGLVEYSRKSITVQVIEFLVTALRCGFSPPYVVLPIIMGAWGTDWPEIRDACTMCYNMYRSYFVSSFPMVLRSIFRFFHGIPLENESPLQCIFNEERKSDLRMQYLNVTIQETKNGDGESEYINFLIHILRSLKLKNEREAALLSKGLSLSILS